MRKNANLAFQGSLMIPLDADSKEEYKALSEPRGDWIRYSERILRKPRWYSITLHLFDTNGSKFHSSNGVDRRLKRDEISTVIHELLCDVMEEFPDVELDKKACRAVLRAVKPKKRK